MLVCRRVFVGFAGSICVSCVDFVLPQQQLREAYAAPVNGGRTSPVVILMVKGGYYRIVAYHHGANGSLGYQFESNNLYIIYYVCENVGTLYMLCFDPLS